MSEAITSKLESIISGHKVNADDADWLRAALSQAGQGGKGEALGPLEQRNIFDAIRQAYDLGYNDARNARAVPGDSAPGYDGRNVEADHGGALFNMLNRRLSAAQPAPAVPVVPEAVAALSKNLKHSAIVVSDWMRENCDANDIPRPHIAVLVTWAKESTHLAGMLSAAPKPAGKEHM